MPKGRCGLVAMVCSFVGSVASAQPAVAQTAVPQATPPAPPYAPPPANAAYATMPPTLRYRTGDPIPPGYHLEERARMGLIRTGLVLTIVPWAVGAVGAFGADFENHSSWLAVPWAGPWLTLGRRDYPCGEDREVKCVGETFAIMGIIADGVMQTAGGTLLLIGALVPKTELVRNDLAVRVTPMSVAGGHGIGLSGRF